MQPDIYNSRSPNIKKGGIAMSIKKVSEKRAEIINLVMSEDFLKSPHNMQEQMLNMQLGELITLNSAENEKIDEAEKKRKQQRFYIRCCLIAVTILLLIIVLMLSIFFFKDSTIPNLIIPAITVIVGFAFGRILPEKTNTFD